jgi:hypothetical protein
MPKYVDQFTEALRFYTELHNDFGEMPDFRQLKEYFLQNQGPDRAENYDQLHRFLLQFGEHYIAQYPSDVAHSCHAVSNGFYETWKNFEWSEAFPLSITIGNVYYKGENIYNTSQDSIARITKEGFQRGKTVDVHVWLTLDDMTVVDLTIISTLQARGAIFATPSKFLLWREEIPTDFVFEPILVDNAFFGRIDTGLIAPMR